MVGRRSKWNTTFWSSALETWVSTKSPQRSNKASRSAWHTATACLINTSRTFHKAKNITFQISTFCCWGLLLVTRSLAQLGKRPWLIFSTRIMWRCVFPNFVPPWSFADLQSAQWILPRLCQKETPRPHLSQVLHLGLFQPPFLLLIPLKYFPNVCRIFMILPFCDHTTVNVFVVVILKQFKGSFFIQGNPFFCET